MSTGTTLLTLLGLLAGRERLKVFAALVLRPGDACDVAFRTGLPIRRALRALAKLEAGGLVGRVDGRWVACDHALSDLVARDRGDDWRVPEPRTGERAERLNQSAVLRAYLRSDGRLVAVPEQRTKRLVVLDHLCRVFEPGVDYPEAEVDTLLRAFHPDPRTLRLHLVADGFLTVENGHYLRVNGTVRL